MLARITNGNESMQSDGLNTALMLESAVLDGINYNKYVFFAICSALLGLPSNILLLVILMRIGLFDKRQNVLSRLPLIHIRSTGSFERFLFEVVFIDTLLIVYNFVDNFLSYLQDDRSTGQHHLIHVSDFCCKFFTYIAKLSILLTTWLLLFLILNQLIFTIQHSNDDNNNNNHNHHRSCWNRGLYYVNAKYSTVFLIFIFSVYNIYPIEVLRYQKKEDQPDYQQGGVPGVCCFGDEYKDSKLLRATNYGYNILGITVPCVAILAISITIIYRTCRKNTAANKECKSVYYIAATIGIVHGLFNLPVRSTDLLLLYSAAYTNSSFMPNLIKFNHEAQSVVLLSYGYKCFICILISRRFRLHAKSVLCFLIESKYENRHVIDRLRSDNEWSKLRKLKTSKKVFYPYYGKELYSTKKLASNSLSTKLPVLPINKKDLHRYKTSDTTSWVRSYFTRNEKPCRLRPCGSSASCHELSIVDSPISSIVVNLPEFKVYQPTTLEHTYLSIVPDSLSYIICIALPNGEYTYIPLPQKRASNYHAPTSVQHCIDSSPDIDTLRNILLSENVNEQITNPINCLSSSHVH